MVLDADENNGIIPTGRFGYDQGRRTVWEMTAESSHRDRLLAAARQLMLVKGFPASKVDEICQQAGVTKGSFYHHFDSKESLALAALDDYFSELAENVSRGAWVQVKAPAERILALVDHLIGIAEGSFLQHGCLIGTLTLDLAETNAEMRQAVHDKFDRLVTVIEPHLQVALPSSANNEALAPRRLAEQLVAVIEGGIILSKASGTPYSVAEHLRCYRALLAGILPPSQERA